jgi:hypothetical protein
MTVAQPVRVKDVDFAPCPSPWSWRRGRLRVDRNRLIILFNIGKGSKSQQPGGVVVKHAGLWKRLKRLEKRAGDPGSNPGRAIKFKSGDLHLNSLIIRYLALRSPILLTHLHAQENVRFASKRTGEPSDSLATR